MTSQNVPEALENLRTVARQAVNAEYLILRRSWGVYYAIWALIISIFILAPYPIINYVPRHAQYIAFLVIYPSLGILASLASFRVFRKANHLIFLKRSLASESIRPMKRWIVHVSWVVVLLMTIFLALGLRNYAGYIVAVVFFAFLDTYIYLIQRRSFPVIPPEGKLAVYAYWFSSAMSLALSVVFRSALLFSLLWIPMVAAWLFASMYALYHSSEYRTEGDEIFGS